MISKVFWNILNVLAGIVIVIGLPFAMALDLFDNLTGWMRK